MSTQLRLNNNQTKDRSGMELVARTNRHASMPIGLSSRLKDWIPDFPGLQPHADWRVAQLKDFIDRQDGQLGPGLEQLCRQLDTGITAAHLSRLFRQEIGLGVREYSKRLRMRAAAQKLTSTSLPIKHIAADLGYRGPADFFRQFKHHFKVTPCKFRILQRRSRNSEGAA
jgi:AraC-like DNA-binding protein